MPSLNVKINVQGAQILSRNILKNKNPRPVLQRIAKQEIRFIKERIQRTKKSPDGVRWAPWAPGTLASRVRRGNVSRGLLYDSGALLNSFRPTFRKQSFRIRSSANYAGFLQNGTRNMPARPFMGWNRRSIKNAEKEFRKFYKTKASIR